MSFSFLSEFHSFVGAWTPLDGNLLEGEFPDLLRCSLNVGYLRVKTFPTSAWMSKWVKEFPLKQVDCDIKVAWRNGDVTNLELFEHVLCQFPSVICQI